MTQEEFSRVATVTSPSTVTRCGLNSIYASMALNIGELQNAMMLRTCCWPTAVPIMPGDVPITAEGFRAKEFAPHGRLARA